MNGAGQFNNVAFSGNIPLNETITNCAQITQGSDLDPFTDNNSSCVDVTVGASNGGGNNGGGNGSTEGWKEVNGYSLNEVIWSINNDLNGDLLAGTAGGNLYRSSNGGVDWTLINEQMSAAFIWDIEVLPDGTIVLGTEQGIFYDDDDNWNGPLLANHDVRTIAVDPASGYLYAGTWGLGVFKSTNQGNDWNEVNTGLSSLVVNTIEIDSQSRIFAGTFGGGVSISTDNAASWSKTSLDYDFIWKLGITSNDDVYAATYGAGVYKTEDSGSSWTQNKSWLRCGLCLFCCCR